jgi:hypothetical protein
MVVDVRRGNDGVLRLLVECLLITLVSSCKLTVPLITPNLPATCAREIICLAVLKEVALLLIRLIASHSLRLQNGSLVRNYT